MSGRVSFEEVKKVLTKYRFERFHDYDIGTNCIRMLGIYEESLPTLLAEIPGWKSVERRRNDSNDFLRVDLVEEVR
jgi:hypothetical protein